MSRCGNSTKHKYRYEGPVMLFGKMVINSWRGETIATSEAKAKNNLAYQVKKQLGKASSSSITLPGKLKIIE